MTITEQITADQEAVTAAQAALDAAHAKLAADQAVAAAAAPHLSLWQEAEAAIAKYGQEAQSEFAAIVAKAKALLNI